MVVVICLLWLYESHIPNFQTYFTKSKIADLHVSLRNWLVELGKKRKYNGIVYFKKNGEELIKLNIGFKDLERDNEIDEYTSFRLASVSKQFTAFGIMVLHKAKKIQYDTPVIKILKDFKNQNITIRHLLNQTSGISVNYFSKAKALKKNKDYVLNIEDATKIICQYTNKNSEPLNYFLYNNSNYVLLARIIEVVSQLSFEEFMNKNIFFKLDLKDTFVWNLMSKNKLSDRSSIAREYEAYLKSRPIEIKPLWIDGVAGDGGVFSSLHDLKKWVSLWNGNKLLDKNDLDEAFKTPKLNDGSYSNYGFGWVIEKDFAWHNGSWLAINSLLVKSKNEDTCLILLDNSTNIRFNKISETIKCVCFNSEI